MTPEEIIYIVRQALLLTVLIGAPAIGAALAVGLVISVLQAVTELRESTLSVAPKLVAVALVLGIFGMWMLREIVTFSVQLLERIAFMG